MSWNSRKQKAVAASSTEAEYVAAAQTSKQCVWIKNLYNEIGLTLDHIPIKVDNKGALFLSQHESQQSQSKHVDIQYHMIRDFVSQGKIKISHISTTEQLTDILTKNVTFDTFQRLRSQIGLRIT